MKILLAPDKFRGSLSASEVCQAMAAGIALVSADIEVIHLPMADGGEGTLDSLLHYSGGGKKTTKVHDPLGNLIDAEFGVSADGSIAFIEMSMSSGLKLIPEKSYNPLITSTFGTGELIKEAEKLGVEKIILGIGGSATNDGGTGMAQALGWQFYDKNNQEIVANGQNLLKIYRIQAPKKLLANVVVAFDVTNPLYGKNGAAQIYAPQKGANQQQVEILDEGLKHLSEVVKKELGKDFAQIPGAGAAGGLGFGAMVFFNAELKEGIKLLMEYAHFDNHLEGVDLVITGEGKIDAQTLNGKLIKGITARANEKNIPVAAICGTLDASPMQIREIGIMYASSLLSRPMNLDEAMLFSYQGVRDATFYLVNLLQNTLNK